MTVVTIVLCINQRLPLRAHRWESYSKSFFILFATSGSRVWPVTFIKLTSKSPGSSPWGAISMKKSDIFPKPSGNKYLTILTNAPGFPWVPRGWAPGGKPLIDTL